MYETFRINLNGQWYLLRGSTYKIDDAVAYIRKNKKLEVDDLNEILTSEYDAELIAQKHLTEVII
jgi:hypothetical protein